MGQRAKYLKSESHWDGSLTHDERLGRWWASASFGLALSGKAARAVHSADRAVAAAEAAREMVQHQAVYALLDEGETVREIASHLGLSKSKVGRMVRSLSRDGELLTFVPPQGTRDDARQMVLDAWRFPDVASSLADHPRGTREPAPSQGPTHFGGVGAAHDGDVPR